MHLHINIVIPEDMIENEKIRIYIKNLSYDIKKEKYIEFYKKYRIEYSKNMSNYIKVVSLIDNLLAKIKDSNEIKKFAYGFDNKELKKISLEITEEFREREKDNITSKKIIASTRPPAS